MKKLKFFQTFGVAIAVAYVFSAYAQSSPAVATSENVASVPMKGDQPSKRKADRKLSSGVRRALSATGGIEMTNVFIRARSGTITLTGSVPNSAQITKAEETAKSVPGVSSVINKLAMSAQNY